MSADVDTVRLLERAWYYQRVSGDTLVGEVADALAAALDRLAAAEAQLPGGSGATSDGVGLGRSDPPGDLWQTIQAQRAANDKLQRKYLTVKGDLRVANERAKAAEARAETLDQKLRDVIGACAPPVEALCIVHPDAKYVAPETLLGLLAARDELRAALAAIVTEAKPLNVPWWPIRCPDCGALLSNGAELQKHLEHEHGVPRDRAVAQMVSMTRAAQQEWNATQPSAEAGK